MALIVWFVAGDEARPDLTIARALRGGPVFDILNADQQLIPKEVAPKGPSLTVALAKGADQSGRAMGGTPKAGRRDVVYAPLEILTDSQELVDMVVDAGAQLIVDVHFPLPRPEQIMAVQDIPDGGERDIDLDETVRDAWRDPIRVEQAYSVLRLADTITVSPVGWFDQTRVGRVPVVSLPDVKTVDDAALFYTGFCTICYELNLRPERWRRWVARFLFRRVMVKAGLAIADRAIIPDAIGATP